MNFFTRFKKLLLIIGFLGIVIVIGYFIWRLFFQTAPQPVIPMDNNLITGGDFPTVGPNTSTGLIPGDSSGLPTSPLPTGDIANLIAQDNTIYNPGPIAVGGVTKTETVNRNPSLNLTLNSEGQLQYYDRREGKFYKLNSDGTKTSLSDKVFHSVKNVTWSPTNDKAIIEYPDGSKIVYNFTTQKQVTIPSHWQDFSFSTSGDKLISKSIGMNTADSWLIISNDDGSQATALEKIGNQHPSVYSAWSPNNQMVAVYTEGLDFNRQEVFFVGLNGENFKSTIIEGRGFQPKWSTNGTDLLYSVYNSNDDFNPRLWVVSASSDAIGENRRQLNLQTWASKCTFASNNDLYCAVPDKLPKGAGLLPELADQTQDSLYKIDLTTGSQKLIAVPDGSYNISQIAVPAEQDYLYFTDKYSGSIYQIKLR